MAVQMTSTSSQEHTPALLILLTALAKPNFCTNEKENMVIQLAGAISSIEQTSTKFSCEFEIQSINWKTKLRINWCCIIKTCWLYIKRITKCFAEYFSFSLFLRYSRCRWRCIVIFVWYWVWASLWFFLF